jgi:hypothetical protein
MKSCEIRGGRSGTGAGSSVCFFCFPLLIIIPPLLHMLQLAPLDVSGVADQGQPRS